MTSLSSQVAEYIPWASPALLELAFLLLTVFSSAVLTRFLAGPLLDLVSRRLGGAVRLFGTVAVIVSGPYLVVSLLALGISEIIMLTVTLALVLAALSGPLKNLFSGDLLRITGSMREGDVVTVQGQTGMVMRIGTLQTLVVTSDLRRRYFPSSLLLSSPFINHTHSGAGLVEVNVTVNGRQISMADAKFIMLKVGTEVAKSELAAGRAADVRVVGVKGDLVELQLRVYVLNPAKSEALSSLILERVYTKLAEVTSAASV